MRDIRHLTPQAPEGVLHELAAALLAAEGESVPDWDIVGPAIADEVDQQASQLLSEAQPSYRVYDRLRARAANRRGRVDPAAGALTAAAVAYAVLVAAGPYFLPVAAARPGPGLTPLVLALLAAGLAVRLPLLWRKRRTLKRDVLGAYEAWTAALRDQVLQPFIVEKRNDEVRNPRLFDTAIGQQSPPRLIEGNEPLRLVETETMAQIRATARNIHSGSLGVSGPRGVGKSTILQWFGTDAGGDDGGSDLRVVVSAPVDYESREFIIHLFTRLCEAVPHGPADGSPIAAETRRYLDQLRYLRTYTSNRSSSVTPKSLGSLTWGSSQERAEQPVTLPELIDSFRGYSGRVASWQRSEHDGKGRVIIGIDEVDKIRDSDRAEAFLNDVKATFGVQGCLYLVSLSEDAMADFARRTPSIRSSFDSAFDELVLVEPMAYRHSEQVLFKRVTGVPRPFTALCHVLGGGLPRDLVRAARALIDVTPDGHERTLDDTARDLIRRDLESLRKASVRQCAQNADARSLLATLHDLEWPGVAAADFAEAARKVVDLEHHAESDFTRQLCRDLVVSLSFYATALEVFAAGKAGQDRLIDCLKKQDYAIIDDLAAVRNAMRVDAVLAHGLLESYRLRNGIGKAYGIT